MSPSRRARLRSLLCAAVLVTVGCGPPPEPTCTLPPVSATAGAALDLELRLEGALPGGELRLVLPHPWYGLGGSAKPTRVEASADGTPVPATWEALEHGRAHAVAELPSSSVATLSMAGLRAPSTAGAAELVILYGRRAHRICPGLALPVAAGPPVELRVVGPSTARPGEDVRVGVRWIDAAGNAVDGPPVDLRWRAVGEGDSVPMAPFEGPHGTVAAPPAGLWRPEAHGAGRSTLGEPLLVADDAPREYWADLHGHGALSDGWSAPEPWFQHARDVAFLDAAALSEHAWQLTAVEWDQLRQATLAASVPGRFAALSAMETNVVGHEVAYLRNPSRLDGGVASGATTIWQETDLGRPTGDFRPRPSDWARDEDVLMVPHTTLDPGMGADLPSRRLGTLRLVEIYSAHGSSAERGGWRALPSPSREPRTSVAELLAAGEQVGFLAAGDSHDGRPGTTRWGGRRGGLTAVRAERLDPDALWLALRDRATVATSGRRVHADASLSGRAIGQTAPPGLLRYRVADVAPPRHIWLVRDGLTRREVPAASPGEWGQVTVTDPFRSLHLEVELHDGERVWLSPWFGRAP